MPEAIFVFMNSAAGATSKFPFTCQLLRGAGSFFKCRSGVGCFSFLSENSKIFPLFSSVTAAAPFLFISVREDFRGAGLELSKRRPR